MAYSDVGIANIALIRIGAKRISALTENSEQAIVINSVWQYIRDEVLSVRDWHFAKVRVALAQNATTPEYNFDFAYTMPADFLRLCRQDRTDASVFTSGIYSEDFFTGQLYLNNIYYPYKIETISDGTICLFTDYDNTDDSLFITYIKRITDATKFSPAFVNCFSNRLAAEIATTITESRAKFQDMMNMYESSLKKAESQNMSLDYQNETGNDDWEMSGRD